MEIKHYGIKRRSGRYPWGSGGDFISKADNLARKGLSQVEIAKAFGMSTYEYRNQRALIVAEEKEAMRLNVTRQKENGMSIEAISREFNIPASTVRDLLKPTANWKFRLIRNTADFLKDAMEKVGFIDVGDGVEAHLNIPRTKLDNAIQLLSNEGYNVYYLKVPQLGTDKYTSVKVLAKPGLEYTDVSKNRGDIQVPNIRTIDGGANYIKPSPVKSVSSNKVLVRYNSDKDGLIELRQGVDELNLGNKKYAQVRIGIDDTHFIKGMAVHRTDLPDGYDIVYYTSKDKGANKLEAFKEQQDYGASRFGAVVSPNTIVRKDGSIDTGNVYIVGGKNPSVEGAWDDWDKNLASQVLSKQSPNLARRQLSIVSKNYQAELDEINSLTNPVVKKQLLMEFADKADRAAVDLKAAALPRQTTSVLLPDPKMNPSEIYAPNYNDGERVSLIRYPHGGVFEIPTLTVNNKGSEFKNIIGRAAPDAVAIHPKVASKLSGADFDGDFVLVIPNKDKRLRTAPSLEGLKNFDPIRSYPKYPGMKIMSEAKKQRLMGDVSNLITDMTIKGAPHSDIARAVRHSMVVIDAAKHELNYKQSYRDNGIAALKERYQGGKTKGASTLISKTTSQHRVPHRLDRYGIDPKTGEKIWTYTENTYIDRKTGNVVPKKTKTTKGAEFDPFDLSSGTIIETVYAEHASKMKDIANQARLETLTTKPHIYSKKEATIYRDEVRSLDAKYKAILRARPLERKAQIVGNEIYKDIVASNPGMSGKDKSKAKGNALILARQRVGAKKPLIEVTPQEWTAIEMGAVSKTRLTEILRNANMDTIRSYAMPKSNKGGISGGKESRAKSLLSAGYTAAEVAGALGVPVHAIRDLKKNN